MSRTPIENQTELRIGVVEFIAPNEFKVQLDIEAPEGIAANTGIPREFPRINSYVLIPNEVGYIVSQVEWIAIEKSPFPKRKGYQDYGLIDLPFPIRIMKTAPLGILKSDLNNNYKFQRGVHTFPSIGSPVLIPTDKQLRSIIESGENRRIYIGNSPLAANAKVMIDPDRLFGRHLAVLGNTGSGKSCTVAGLIHWSIVEAKKELLEGQNEVNARFVILDPNGEYSKAFREQAKILTVGGDGENNLDVPLWLWNSAEWSAFTQASAKAQLPLLKRALRAMRNEEYEISESIDIKIKKVLGTILISLKHDFSKGNPWTDFPKPKNFYNKLCKWLESFKDLRNQLDTNDRRLDELIIKFTGFKESRTGQHPTFEASVEEIENLIYKLETAYANFGGSHHELLPKHEDIPIPFPGNIFMEYLKTLAQESGSEQYLEFLITRIRTMLSDSKMNSIIGDQITITLDKWLEKYLGKDDKTSITIIDLSFVPIEIIHIITAVISRIIFEALQRYRKLTGNILPSVIVMEEAHSYIKKYSEGNEYNANAICTKVFEKISREGRKFGLSLVLSSQRPSELSQTVLSQCNSFILHRINNDKDQELVSKLLPDSFRGLLKELPTLPTQQAILLGWASELPILVKIRDLEENFRPKSDDPDFWNVWIRKNVKNKKVERKIDWKKIADDWQEKSTND